MAAGAETPLTYPEELVISGRPDMYLRLTSTRDLEAIHALIAANWEYLEQFQHLDEADSTLAAVSKALDQTIQDTYDGKALQYLIVTTDAEAANENPIGRVSFDFEQDEVRLGYWVGQEFQGKGRASAAARRLVKFGFEDMDLDKILVRIDDRNGKSQRVAKKLGAQITPRADIHEKAGHQITYRVWEIDKYE